MFLVNDSLHHKTLGPIVRLETSHLARPAVQVDAVIERVDAGPAGTLELWFGAEFDAAYVALLDETGFDEDWRCVDCGSECASGKDCQKGDHLFGGVSLSERL